MTTNEQLTMLTQNALCLADVIWRGDGEDSVASEIAELLDVLRSMRQLLAADDRPLTRYHVGVTLTLYGFDIVYAPSSAMAEEYIKDYFKRYITHSLRNLDVGEIKACASRG